MKWNNNKNAIQNDPMLSDAEERDKVLEGFLEWENEMLPLRDSDIDQTTTNSLSSDSNSSPYSTLLQPPSITSECVEQADYPRAVKKINISPPKRSFPNKKQQKRERPQKNNQKTDDSYETPMNASTPFPVTSQPSSVVILPELEQGSSSRHVKKNTPSNSGKKRGRPTKNDDEGNVDAKTLKKRIYARKYQRGKRGEGEKYAKLFHSLCYNLKKIDANNPKYNGILELLEECDAEFKKMNIKN